MENYLNKDFFRKHIVDVLFIQNNLFNSQPTDYLIDEFIEIGKTVSEFFTISSMKVIEKEVENSFSKKLEGHLSSIFELEHEENDVPQMEDILPLQYQIEKNKYFKKLNSFLKWEHEQTPEAIERLELFKSKNIVSSVEELFDE